MDVKKFLLIMTASLMMCSTVSCSKCGGWFSKASDCDDAEEIIPTEQSFCDTVRLYAPGDYGSANWRIPAILCLDDGTLLVVNDKRKFNESDLPQDIDIVIRRSSDLGKTWTEPETIITGTGVGHGYGDPALVQCASGDVICAFAGGNGYFASTADNPISVYTMRSTDHGRTWGDMQNITPAIWGADDEGNNYHGAFIASGNGLRLKRGAHAGRILFVAALCRNGNNVSDNYIVYSDDNGQTWHRSQKAFTQGDEAKAIELNDGRVLMSVRRTGARGWCVSDDSGETWGGEYYWNEMQANACNGEMLRVDDTTLLHSIPNSMERRNVSVFTSNDEGASWHSPVTLFEGPSVYSSMTLLPDGTVAAYIERNPNGACELWYYRFNMEWLRQQQGK